MQCNLHLASDVCSRGPVPSIRPSKDILAIRLPAVQASGRRCTPLNRQVSCTARAAVNAAATLKMPQKSRYNCSVEQVAMRTQQDCQLAISVYPSFTYDARGGGGVAETSGHGSDRLQMTFDPKTLSIPDVSHRTAKFLGVPLPPCFKIGIITRSLAGWLKPKTGEVQLDFVASFFFTFSIFGWVLYRARPLEVTTRLTTETVKGRTLGGSGSRIDADGNARLVGVADVQKCGDALFDAFLRLPGDTFSMMSAHFAY